MTMAVRIVQRELYSHTSSYSKQPINYKCYVKLTLLQSTQDTCCDMFIGHKSEGMKTNLYYSVNWKMIYLSTLNMHISRLTNCKFCNGLIATMVCKTGE